MEGKITGGFSTRLHRHQALGLIPAYNDNLDTPYMVLSKRECLNGDTANTNNFSI